MKYLLLLLTFAAAAVSAQTLERLSPAGCHFVGSAAACATQEVTGSIPAGDCQKVASKLLEAEKINQPKYDYSLIEQITAQEIARSKSIQQKDPQVAYETFYEKCFAAEGLIKNLLNPKL